MDTVDGAAINVLSAHSCDHSNFDCLVSGSSTPNPKPIYDLTRLEPESQA